MKNKQKFTVSEKSLLNKIERIDKEVDRKYLELRAKRKIASNPLIQKNLGFLQSYNNLFKRSSQFSGDADSVFKKSLRNYSVSWDIIRDLNLESSTLLKKKTAKQRSAFTKHHPCADRIPLSKEPKEFQKQDTTTANRVVEGTSSIKELFSKESPKETFESSSESEDRDFFSPLPNFLAEYDEFKGLPPLEELHSDHFPTLLKLNTAEDTEDEKDSSEEDHSFKRGSRINITYLLSSEENLVESKEKGTANQIKMAEEFSGEDMNEEDEFNADDTEYEDEVGDDELKDVEQMIQQASEELQKVAEENQQMMETLHEGEEDEELVEVTDPKGEAKQGEAGGDGSYFKFDPAIDAAVLKELEEAEKEAKKTAKVITELKDRVGELLKNEKMTEVEARELEEKNKALKAQMILFEEKTKRIQFLLGQANLFEKMTAVQPPLQTKHAEDVLPKMLVCGVADSFMPKLVLCQNRCDKDEKSRSVSAKEKRRSSGGPRQDDFYKDRPLTSGDNRYRQQQPNIGYFEKQLCGAQNDMRMVNQQAAMLNDQMQGCPNPDCPKNSRSNSPSRGGGTACGPGRGLCPADVENRLQEYSNTTHQLEKQLVDVEQEVKTIQQELIEVQREREHLEHHRKMLAVQPSCYPQPPCPYSPPCPPPPCPPYPCMPSPCMPPPCGHPPCPPMPCPMPPPCCPPEASGDDQRLREIKEKYSRLQEDFKAKLTEVAGLRADNEKLKELTERAEESRAKMELKVKELEKKLKDLRGDGDKGVTTKEQLIELQQQIKIHKEMYRQAQDELEELRGLVEDIQGQLADYRNKYLEALQIVEEQRRQIECMRMENNRISEQVNLEILRVKNQFQEKLQELAPLPDILKATQLKLQEAQQMHLLAERNNEALANELQMYKDKLKAIEDEMALSASNNADGIGEKEALTRRVTDLENQVQDLKNENDELQIEMEKLKEISDENEHLANEKLHEITQLESQLEAVREDSARQVSRIKDRCEIVRKSMQNQINDLERQLAQMRACVKSAEKDRDDIRLKMAAQIRNLNENFEDAQMRIKNLQGHVNFLKTTTCMEPTTMLPPREKPPDPCCCNAQY